MGKQLDLGFFSLPYLKSLDTRLTYILLFNKYQPLLDILALTRYIVLIIVVCVNLLNFELLISVQKMAKRSLCDINFSMNDSIEGAIL